MGSAGMYSAPMSAGEISERTHNRPGSPIGVDDNVDDEQTQPYEEQLSQSSAASSRYSVEKVVDADSRGRYLVRWAGCTEEDDTWERSKDVPEDKIAAYEEMMRKANPEFQTQVPISQWRAQAMETSPATSDTSQSEPGSSGRRTSDRKRSRVVAFNIGSNKAKSYTQQPTRRRLVRTYRHPTHDPPKIMHNLTCCMHSPTSQNSPTTIVEWRQACGTKQRRANETQNSMHSLPIVTIAH